MICLILKDVRDVRKEMKIPKKLKIGGHIYRVVFQKETDLASNDCGKTDRVKGIVAIDKDLIQSEKEETLFHEIMHIINNEYKEVEIDFLAQAIYATLKGNNLLK